MLSPCAGWSLHVSSLETSGQANGLKGGFEEEREFQEFHNDKLIEPYGGLLGSRQKCTEFYASGISRWSALRH